MSDLLIKPRVTPGSRRLLVVFHHAGGLALTYMPWVQAMSSDWQVALFEMPGRGLNREILAPKDIAEFFPDLLEEIEDLAGDRSITLFGHSFGGLIAYETALRIGSDLDTLIISAIAPNAFRKFESTKETETFYQQMEDPELLPVAVRQRPDALHVYRENLRVDSELIKRWRPSKQVRTRTFILGGRDDQLVPLATLNLWQDYIHYPQIKSFAGGHFYWEQNLSVLAQMLDDLPSKRERLI